MFSNRFVVRTQTVMEIWIFGWSNIEQVTIVCWEDDYYFIIQSVGIEERVLLGMFRFQLFTRCLGEGTINASSKGSRNKGSYIANDKRSQRVVNFCAAAAWSPAWLSLQWYGAAAHQNVPFTYVSFYVREIMSILFLQQNDNYFYKGKHWLVFLSIACGFSCLWDGKEECAKNVEPCTPVRKTQPLRLGHKHIGACHEEQRHAPCLQPNDTCCELSRSVYEALKLLKRQTNAFFWGHFWGHPPLIFLWSNLVKLPKMTYLVPKIRFVTHHSSIFISVPLRATRVVLQILFYYCYEFTVLLQLWKMHHDLWRWSADPHELRGHVW